MRTTLEKTLSRAEACLASGTKFVSSVSLDPAVAIASLRLAGSRSRDLSFIVGEALASYVERHGPPPADLAERLARLTAALEADKGLAAEIDQLIARSSRRKRTREAAA
jgi:predicted transcriptional regulator